MTLTTCEIPASPSPTHALVRFALRQAFAREGKEEGRGHVKVRAVSHRQDLGGNQRKGRPDRYFQRHPKKLTLTTTL